MKRKIIRKSENTTMQKGFHLEAFFIFQPSHLVNVAESLKGLRSSKLFHRY